MSPRRPFLPGLLLAAVAVPLTAAPLAPAAEQEADTVTAERGPFTVTREFQGTFDAPHAVEVAFRPESYSGPLEVVEAAAPGPVTEGQCLVRFDPEAIDRQLEQAELDLKLARNNLERMVREARQKEEAQAIALKSTEMAYERARQTLKDYRETLMPMRIQEAELSLQSSKDRMAEQEEQFEQLVKMYQSDDLMEETEEIVLRRSRRSLEQARRRMEFTLQRHQLQMEVDIPRELEGHEFSLRKATNDWELAQATAELKLEQARAELAKASMALARQELALEELKADREALTVCAPAAGIAVPGQLVKGKWTRLPDHGGSMRPGDKASANQVLFTIVSPGPRMVRTSIPEASVLEVRPGQAASVTPTATPDHALAATVAQVALVSANGSYDAWLEVTDEDERLLPGHGCSIAVTTEELADAITVPATAVTRKDGDHVVHLVTAAGTETRVVEVGPSDEDRTVIRSGLAAGDAVLRKAPSER